jgi:hypothetical protein
LRGILTCGVHPHIENMIKDHHELSGGQTLNLEYSEYLDSTVRQNATDLFIRRIGMSEIAKFAGFGWNRELGRGMAVDESLKRDCQLGYFRAPSDDFTLVSVRKIIITTFSLTSFIRQ